MMLNKDEEVIVVCIWDKGEDVYTRSILVDRKTTERKYKGKKPNKIIIPESLNSKHLMKAIKKLAAYDCVIVKAKGK